jgi:hypothetical protein
LSSLVADLVAFTGRVAAVVSLPVKFPDGNPVAAGHAVKAMQAPATRPVRRFESHARRQGDRSLLRSRMVTRSASKD